jgi:hypothetical protein
MAVLPAVLAGALRRPLPVAGALAATLALGACGGGVYWNFGFGGDGTPPSVTLAAATDSVRAGQALRVVAAASDESGIDHVSFYRVDAGGPTLLGSVATPPYEWIVTAPADGRSSLALFARATDGVGHHADSALLTVAVTP